MCSNLDCIEGIGAVRCTIRYEAQSDDMSFNFVQLGASTRTAESILDTQPSPPELRIQMGLRGEEVFEKSERNWRRKLDFQ